MNSSSVPLTRLTTSLGRASAPSGSFKSAGAFGNRRFCLRGSASEVGGAHGTGLVNKLRGDANAAAAGDHRYRRGRAVSPVDQATARICAAGLSTEMTARPRQRDPGPRGCSRGNASESSALPWGALTYGGHDGAHEVEGAGEVPARAGVVHPDAGLGGLLVVAEETAQLVAAQVVAAAEVGQALLPALLGLQLVRQLQRREDRGAAQQVEHDERGEQQEARVVLVQVARAAAATPAGHGRAPAGSASPDGRRSRAQDPRGARLAHGRWALPPAARLRRPQPRRSCRASVPPPPGRRVSGPLSRRRRRPPWRYPERGRSGQAPSPRLLGTRMRARFAPRRPGGLRLGRRRGASSGQTRVDLNFPRSRGPGAWEAGG